MKAKEERRSEEQERLLWAFLDWARAQGYALCARTRWATTRSGGTTAARDMQWHEAWMPLVESAGTLLERFGASVELQPHGGQRQRDEEDLAL